MAAVTVTLNHDDLIPLLELTNSPTPVTTNQAIQKLLQLLLTATTT